VLANAGNQLMSLTDAIMVGRLGAASLAGVGIGNGLYFTASIFGIGLVMGMDAPVSQAVGAGEPARARRVLWHGIKIAVVAGIVLALITSLTPLLLPLAGITPAVTREATHFLLARLPNVVPFLVFVSIRAYLQAVGVTRPMIIATIVGNVANVFGNWGLIYGIEPLGIPPLGVAGSALASTGASVLMLGVMVLSVRAVAAPADPERRKWEPALGKMMLRLGWPIAFQLLAEVGAFALAGVTCASMGELSGAAHQVALTLASFTFTLTLGISEATSVRVGTHIGHGDTPRARRAGFLGFASAAALMTAGGILFLTIPALLASAIAPAPEIVAAAIPLIGVAALFQIFDGIQAVGGGALRGAGDTKAAFYANVVGYYVLGLPIGVFLAFALRMGPIGVWWGLSAGLIVVAIVLVVRFARLSSRPIRRVG
jgi:multidrug resistance protein, MATE family